MPAHAHIPPWVRHLLSDRQLDSLNPSLMWLIVVQRAHILDSTAINVAGGLYTSAPKTGAEFHVGLRRIAENLARSRNFVSTGISNLDEAGFLLLTARREGERGGYVLTFPSDTPSGYDSEPRRTGGYQREPRRTGELQTESGYDSEPPGYDSEPGWLPERATTGSHREPRRTLQSALKSASGANVASADDAAPEGDVAGSPPPDDVKQQIAKALGRIGAVDEDQDAEEFERQRRETLQRIASWEPEAS